MNVRYMYNKEADEARLVLLNDNSCYLTLENDHSVNFKARHFKDYSWAIMKLEKCGYHLI